EWRGGGRGEGVTLLGAATERTVFVHNRRAVPADIGLVDRNRLEYLDVIAEQREIGKHVDVDRLRRSEIENLLRLRAEPAAQLPGIIFGARRGPFHRPQSARALPDVAPF